MIEIPPTGIFDRRHSTTDESTVSKMAKFQIRKNSLSITEECEQTDENGDHLTQLEAFKQKILNTKLTEEENRDASGLPREKMLLRGQSQAVITMAEE